MQKSSPPEDKKRYPTISEWLLPGVKFAQCPIRTSLDILGKKWSMLVLRDIGILGVDRFSRLLNSIPGLTPRVLSMRLKELEKEGLIECIEKGKSPMIVRWTITEKGRDVIPILLMFTAFGSKWHADVVFEDKTPRTLDELFQPKAMNMMRNIFTCQKNSKYH
ncbi:MAG: helix-turn-helix transcriptional regulator [Thermoproteota archaeon]|nr:helix-turn-helix transcriptional regulator [Thermoproteota archaeon]